MRTARLIVATCFVVLMVGSLWWMPWEGWVREPLAPGGNPVWRQAVRTGSFWTPPAGLWGDDPMTVGFGTAMGVPPKMRPERLYVVWLVSAAVGGWLLLIVSRPPRPELAASPSPAPRG